MIYLLTFTEDNNLKRTDENSSTFEINMNIHNVLALRFFKIMYLSIFIIYYII